MSVQTAGTISEIRNTFLNYFQSKNHLIVPSAGLLPAGDPTLLFTTAGMVPFKDYFAGRSTPPQDRITSVQKCLRTTDLEEVGRTKRHLTFFEMLGNFSFGDYFKKEAIEFAWEYTTHYLPFDKEKIWVSIYQDDKEAFDLWKKHIGIPESRIVGLGKKDNFWGPAGETGACGPCSELYLDRGLEFGPNDRAPGDDGDRFMEFWNLVFNQYFFNGKEYLPLGKTGIDTGAGLERLATLVQNVDSVFDTDELKKIRDQVASVYGVYYEGENITPIRVITDHVRTLVFAMSDGIYPSNESRGYVLRRVLRRALLFGRKIGQRKPQLYKLVSAVKNVYGSFYKQLQASASIAENFVKQEEVRFLQTLDAGSGKLDELFEKLKEGAFEENKIPGRDVFVLYDTFGFPPEMTEELALQNNAKIDWKGFHSEMEKQKERGRNAFKGKSQQLDIDESIQSDFCGYEKLELVSEVVTLFESEKSVKKIDKDLGDACLLISKSTPFYAESGGQLGDTGVVSWETGNAEVIDTQKNKNTILHVLGNVEGELSVGQSIRLIVDSKRRNRLAQHHSATHLLNAALRKQYGDYIKQSGSLVHPDYLRFDFTHPSSIETEALDKIENMVNAEITSDSEMVTQILPKEEALKTGAIMAFGEKYADVVRVVNLGSSIEFCGGTHVNRLSKINIFIITKESSPGAGNRRVEALAGKAALDKIEEEQNEIESLVKEINLNRDFLDEKNKNDFEIFRKEWDRKKLASSVQEKLELWQFIRKEKPLLQELLKKLRKNKKKKSESKILVDEGLLENLMQNQKEKNSLNVIEAVGAYGGLQDLRKMGDLLKERTSNSLILLASPSENKSFILATMHKEIAQKKNIDLSAAVKTVFSKHNFKGGGGGRPDMVSASLQNSDPKQCKKFLEVLQIQLGIM